MTQTGTCQTTTTTYKRIGELELTMHLFTPAGPAPDGGRPGIVFFHGGGWRGGTPNQFFRHCQHLAERGMVAASAQYRLGEANGATPAEALQDARSAVRWMRQQAKTLGLDPQRLAVGGGSAGGHLAAATTLCSGFDEPGEATEISCRGNALALFNPVIDNSPEGYGHDRVRDYWRAFSPLHNLSAASPPTLICLGSADELIPVATMEAYRDCLETHGVRCELDIYDGQPHGFFNHARYAETLQRLDDFLVSLGYLPPGK